MPSFNLADESWIPCAARAGGMPRLLSLREVFAEAPRLVSLADPSPAVTISLYRMLLAILHRSLNGPRSVDEWRTIMERGAWDLDTITAYINRWHERFDLFDARHPFYQTPDLKADDPPAAWQLAQERASERNRSQLFDHTTDDVSMTPAEAARYLVAMHNFAVRGLISLQPSEPIANKTTSQAPLLGVAVVLIRGDTLFETLMLNWVRYHREDSAPFPFNGDDKPAWEREGGAEPVPRLPDGHVDLLTWQSRRIALVPELSPDGATRVRAASLMKGYQFAESFEPWNSETMVAYRKNTNTKAESGLAWFAVGLDRDRVIWRDSQTLIQSVAGEELRPKVMDWLDMLVGRRALPYRPLLPIQIFGLIPDQANTLDWRRESLPLPVRLLEQRQEATPHLLERLRQAITLAEDVGHLLAVGWVQVGSRDKGVPSPMWKLCEALLAGLSEREPKRKDCEEFARGLGAGPRYWSGLDAPFRAFISGLADTSDMSVEEGATRYGMRALRGWASEVGRVARDDFESILADLDGSARSLRAATEARQRFAYLLAALMAPYRAPSDASET